MGEVYAAIHRGGWLPLVGGGGDPIKVERKFPTTFWNM